MIHSDANIPVCRVPRTCAHTPHPHTAACLLHTRVDFAFAVTRQAFLKVLSLVVASRVRGLDRRSKGLADRFSRDSTHRFSRACVPAGCRARATRAGPRVAPGRQPPPPTGIPIADHTGIVCENMHALGANLRKLPGQAKICTPPGGCDGCENIGDKYSGRGFTHHKLTYSDKRDSREYPSPKHNCSPARGGDVLQASPVLSNSGPSSSPSSRALRGVFAKICIPHPGRMGQLAKICTGDCPGADCENMRNAKIITIPVCCEH